MKANSKKIIRPKQTQNKQPGIESKMLPKPSFLPSEKELKLKGKIALITGGDSGIGRAVAVAFAKEGAKVLISYLSEHDDAKLTVNEIKKLKAECHKISGDISKESHCKKIINEVIKKFGGIDILVNNAAVQFPQESLLDINKQQLERTFSTNIFAQFYLTKAALKHMKAGSNIICTTSVTAYRGSAHLIDYASTKSAIVGFIRSLSSSLADKKIRVNGVAPGPIWTPLIPATFNAKEVAEFGSDVPLKRAGEPDEVAPSYVFLASDDASYMTGQILHPNGGEIING
jgi:NAD(P)-dependent dehydrogenase (short-subunit alcohol dehydrogenase family)